MPRTTQLFSIPSKKICEKKLREIKALKEKQKRQPLNAEEKIKVERESYFQKIIRTEHEKLLERLPDEIQQIILSFVDRNTRLRILHAKYNHTTVRNQLLTLPKTRATIDHLVKLTEYVSPILNQVLDKNGDLYKRVFLYNDAGRQRISESIDLDFNTYSKFYIERLTYTVEVALKYFTKMYKIKQHLSNHTLLINEVTMFHLYARLLLVIGIRQPSTHCPTKSSLMRPSGMLV